MVAIGVWGKKAIRNPYMEIYGYVKPDPSIVVDELSGSRKKLVEEILKTKNYIWESKWTQSITVGSKNFVEGIKEKLGIRAKSRKVVGSEDLYHLREAQAAYNSNFIPENGVLSGKNTYIWNDSP